LAAVITAGASCSSGHRTDPTTTTSPTSTTFSPTGSNPDVIPSVITPAYVDAVFKVLNHIYGNATRALKASDRVTPEVQADLRAIFNDPMYASQVAEAQQSLDGPIENVRANSGDAVTTVRRVIATAVGCIYVQTMTSLTDVLINQTPSPTDEYYTLQRKQPGADPNDLNSTPWAISFNVDYLVPTTAPPQCPE
jgi:hypothetical protein